MTIGGETHGVSPYTNGADMSYEASMLVGAVSHA
jgi:hypothetical protein